MRVFKGHSGSITTLAVLADGRRAVSVGDETFRLWDLETGETMRIFEGRTHWNSPVTVLADTCRAISNFWDNTLRLWDLETGKTLRILVEDAGYERAVAVTADGRRALTSTWDLGTYPHCACGISEPARPYAPSKVIRLG